SGGKAGRGADDANLGSHAHFAQEIVLDGVHVEVDAAGRLGDKLDGAEFESFKGAGRAVFGFGADDDDGARIGGHDVRGGLQAVHVGHIDVHGDYIGLEGLGESDGFATVLGVSDDLKLGVGIENV